MLTATLPHSSQSSALAKPNSHQAALERCVERVKSTSRIFGLRNPQIGSVEDGWQYCNPFDWVISFYPGQLWLAYQFNGEPGLANLARARQADLNLLLSNLAAQDHDLGFIFSLNCVADWKLTGSQTARQMALRAAEALRARFRPAGGYIQAWNSHGTENTTRSTFVAGRIIADTMQNLALLYWAHAETGAPDFKTIADAHAEATRRNLIREDGTSFHTFVFDTTTGAPLRGETHQGYAHDSCWARGQAWLVHGFAQSYRATGNSEYLDAARLVAAKAEELMGADRVPLWDLRLPADEPQYLDSSAGAILSAGLFILADVTSGEEKIRWHAFADRLLDGLIETCDVTQIEGAQGLLDYGAAHVRRGSVRNMLPYGDYYFMEALMRSLGHSRFCW